MEDIEAVNEIRPEYIGFVFFPGSRRYIPAADAGKLREKLNPEIRAVGVFVDEDPETVAALLEDGIIDMAQLHGHEDEDYLARLRENAGYEVWKAFRVRSREDLDIAESSCADRILMDSGYGSGEAFDWSLAADFIRPFILAGGLRVETIAEAVQILKPELIDISSGVESGRLKDREKIIAAVRAAHGAFPEAAC
jgi:phosphoribosylanthranilate isomerase